MHPLKQPWSGQSKTGSMQNLRRARVGTAVARGAGAAAVREGERREHERRHAPVISAAARRGRAIVSGRRIVGGDAGILRRTGISTPAGASPTRPRARAVRAGVIARRLHVVASELATGAAAPVVGRGGRQGRVGARSTTRTPQEGHEADQANPGGHSTIFWLDRFTRRRLTEPEGWGYLPPRPMSCHFRPWEALQ